MYDTIEIRQGNVRYTTFNREDWEEVCDVLERAYANWRTADFDSLSLTRHILVASEAAEKPFYLVIELKSRTDANLWTDCAVFMGAGIAHTRRLLKEITEEE